MIHDKLFFDIETLPTIDPDLIADITAKISAPATMSKPETIAKWEAEHKPAAISEAVRKTSLDGGTGRIASIAWAFGDDVIHGYHSAHSGGWNLGTERGLLHSFFCDADAANFRTGGVVLVGHNIVGFDIRWLWKRAIVLGVQIPEWWPISAKPWSPEVFDTMIAWEGHGGRISQDRLGRILNVGGKGDVDGSQVADLWDAGRYDDVFDYNCDDVVKVRKIWARITQFDGAVEQEMAAAA